MEQLTDNLQEQIAVIKKNLHIPFWEAPDLIAKHPGIRSYLSEAEKRIEEYITTLVPTSLSNTAYPEAQILAHASLVYTRYGKALVNAYLPLIKRDVEEKVLAEFDWKYDDKEVWQQMDQKKVFMGILAGILKLLVIEDIREKFASVTP